MILTWGNFGFLVNNIEEDELVYFGVPFVDFWFRLGPTLTFFYYFSYDYIAIDETGVIDCLLVFVVATCGWRIWGAAFNWGGGADSFTNISFWWFYSLFCFDSIMLMRLLLAIKAPGPGDSLAIWLTTKDFAFCDYPDSGFAIITDNFGY